MKPIRDYEAERAEFFKPALADHQADIAAWEAKHAGLKEKIKSDTKARKPTIGIESELRDLEQSKPQAPKVPRVIYSDVTPEALAYALGTKWPAGGVVSSEGGIVFGSHGMGSDSVMRNMATLNQMWDGGAVQIDRRSSDSFVLHGARLTVAVQVQEPTLRAFLDKSGALARGTGFLARFLIAWPASTQGTRLYQEAPEHWPHLTTFNERITEILKQDVPMDEQGRLKPLMLALSPEAKAAWIAFHDTVESSLGVGGDLHDVRDVASKSADNAARMAALFHVFSGATGPIGIESFESAASIVAWHLSESRRFFSELSVPDDQANAERLDTWLIEHCTAEGVTTVDKSRALQLGPLRKAETLNFALRTLEELGRVRMERIGRRAVVHIHPSLLSPGVSK